MRDTFTWEKNMMKYADEWYHKMGIKNIDRSVQSPAFDLLADGIKIEEKFLFSGREYANVLVEMVQDMAEGKLGWFYHCKADKLAWFYCPSTHEDKPSSVYVLKFKELKEYTINLLSNGNNKWMEFQVCSIHYGVTLNLPILWNDLIDRGIAKYYNLENR